MVAMAVNSGERYGRLTIIEEVESTFYPNYKYPTCRNRIRRFLCQCDCGKMSTVKLCNLRNGKTTSCGCRRAEVTDQTTHGESKGVLYRTWNHMRQRCQNPRDSGFDHYGGRGITVCEEWSDFPTFQDWALSNGYDGSLTIERIDVNGPYCPENCTWATIKTQARNKTNTAYLEAFGERKSMADWADDPRCKVKYCALQMRLRRGWGVERSISTPPIPRHSRSTMF